MSDTKQNTARKQNTCAHGRRMKQSDMRARVPAASVSLGPVFLSQTAESALGFSQTAKSALGHTHLIR